MFLAIRHSDANRRMAIDEVHRIHQAVIASRTARFHGKYSLIRCDLDLVEPLARLFNDLLYLANGHIGKIVSVDHHNGT